MGAASHAARCEEHGLACGPDGRCVLCRRTSVPQPEGSLSLPLPPGVPDGATRTFTQRVLSWPPALKLPGIASAANALRRTWPGTTLPPQSSESPPGAAPARAESGPIPTGAPESSKRPTMRSGPAALRVALSLPPIPGSGFVVTFYSLSTCTVCRAARDYLQQHGIPFNERDVQHDSAAAADALKLNPRRSVPTFDFGRGEVVVGFTPAELEAALARMITRD